MAWIESHQALGRHPKTQQLATLLKVGLPAVVGHLHYLWWWALDFAPTGVIPNATPVVVARAAEWKGPPDRFWLAMIQSGFIEVNEDCVSIHDWLDYAGKLMHRRAANAERQRRHREPPVTRDKPVTSRADNAHVTVLPTGPTGDSVAVSLNQPDQPPPLVTDAADAQGPTGTASAPGQSPKPAAQTCPMCNRTFIGPYADHRCAIGRPPRQLGKLFGQKSDIPPEELDRVERELGEYRQRLDAQKTEQQVAQ